MARIVFTRAHLIDGIGAPRSDASVVVEGERIVQVTDGAVPVGPNDRSIDLAGKTLMPGMASCHFHSTYHELRLLTAPLGLEKPPGYLMLAAAANLKTALDCGFTSVVSAGAIGDDVDAQCKLAIEDGLISGPRLIPGSRGLDIEGGYSDSESWWWKLQNHGAHRYCSGPESFRAAVREEVKRGAEIIKIFPSGGHGTEIPHTGISLTQAELEAVCETAHSRGARVRAHSPMKESILACIRAGVDVIDHADELDEECIELMLRTDTTLVPSMFFTDQVLRQTGGYAAEMAAEMGAMREGFERLGRTLPAAQAAGVRIVIGDDYGVDFLSHGRYAEELAFYVDTVGISPLDVVGWATRNGAEMMGMGAELGCIEAGRLADLLVVDGDPIREIGVLQDRERISAIMKGGAFYKDDARVG